MSARVLVHVHPHPPPTRPIAMLITTTTMTTTSSSVKVQIAPRLHPDCRRRRPASISVTYISTYCRYMHTRHGTAHHALLSPYHTTQPLISQQQAGNQYFIQIYRYRLYSLLYRGYTVSRVHRTNGIATQTQISARLLRYCLSHHHHHHHHHSLSLPCLSATNIDYLFCFFFCLFFCLFFKVITKLLSHAETRACVS
ncbi:hypothetical protein F4803DRAFT_490099 [Xylaria telfairii]|nr:hypothetical protein F4803DRAFT_490099 [Xylaria telfairii]